MRFLRRAARRKVAFRLGGYTFQLLPHDLTERGRLVIHALLAVSWAAGARNAYIGLLRWRSWYWGSREPYEGYPFRSLGCCPLFVLVYGTWLHDPKATPSIQAKAAE